MNFAEVRFWYILAIGLITTLIIGRAIAKLWPDRLPVFDKLGLLGVGMVLLGAVSGVTFALFLIVALGTYASMLGAQKLAPAYRARSLWVIVPLQLTPLIYYKYANFFTADVLGYRIDTLQNLVIPAGISFYTFQKVAFAVDTLMRGEPLPSILNYLNFAGFFPQIVAGPIERRAELLPQMEGFRLRWNTEDIAAGFPYLVIGFFFKCCLADNLGDLKLQDSVTNPFCIWLANVVFGFRIYYDFAGYSFIALGIARVLGVRLTANFASPYCATNATQFWRRWHITLSQWFRDYLYMPLGGGRVSRWALNVMIVFVVSGIWHGAGWNFLLWGAIHGFTLVAHRAFSRIYRMPPIAGWIITIAVVFASWLPFYESRSHFLFLKISTILSPSAYTLAGMRSAAAYWLGPNGLSLAVLLGFTGASLVGEILSLSRGNEAYRYFRHPVALAILVVCTVLLSPSGGNGFIYFAF